MDNYAKILVEAGYVFGIAQAELPDAQEYYGAMRIESDNMSKLYGREIRRAAVLVGTWESSLQEVAAQTLHLLQKAFIRADAGELLRRYIEAVKAGIRRGYG